MIYVANNPILYNAAIAGFYAAGGGGAAPVGSSAAGAAANAEIQANAEAFAQAVDTAIAADATITTSGATIAGSAATAAQTNAQLSKSGILRMICYDAIKGQAVAGTAPTAVITGVTAAVVAKYASAVATPLSLL